MYYPRNVAYIWAEDILLALERCSIQGEISRKSISAIRVLTTAEASTLEKALQDDRGWSVRSAKMEIVKYNMNGPKPAPV